MIDAESTDDTAERARGCGAEVVVRPWNGFVDARRDAIARVTTPWVLMLDADEVLDETLRAAVLQADESVDGYFVHRDTYVGDARMRVWSREPLIRLFRRDAARVETRAGIAEAALHEYVVVRGRVDPLPGTLLHFSYATIAEYWRKLERYTGIEARAARPSLVGALWNAFLISPRFLRLLAKGAAFDGVAGWNVAYGSALYPAVVAMRALMRR